MYVARWSCVRCIDVGMSVKPYNSYLFSATAIKRGYACGAANRDRVIATQNDRHGPLGQCSLNHLFQFLGSRGYLGKEPGFVVRAPDSFRWVDVDVARIADV